jgi:hypothetical protein
MERLGEGHACAGNDHMPICPQVAKETTSGAVSMTFNHINFTNAYRYE